MLFDRNVLDWANRVRAEHNLGEPLTELPKGLIDNSFQCPIARALGHNTQVDGEDAYLHSDEHEAINLPPYVRTFVQDFDAGLIPHMVDAA